jgi:hypothetical protein
LVGSKASPVTFLANRTKYLELTVYIIFIRRNMTESSSPINTASGPDRMTLAAPSEPVEEENDDMEIFEEANETEDAIIDSDSGLMEQDDPTILAGNTANNSPTLEAARKREYDRINSSNINNNNNLSRDLGDLSLDEDHTMESSPRGRPPQQRDHPNPIRCINPASEINSKLDTQVR